MVRLLHAFIFVSVAIFASTSLAENVGPVFDNNITASHAFGSSSTIEIVGNVYITEGVEFTIGAGSTVEMQPGSNLIVAPGATLKVLGTKLNPVIFRLAKSSQLAGLESIANGQAGLDSLTSSWGAVVVCGGAPIAEEDHTIPTSRGGGRQIDLSESENGELPTIVWCGGDHADDNSGEITYARFEQSSGGLILAGVGSRTVLHHIETSFGAGGGIEIVGGDARLHHISMVYNRDSCLEMSRGYRGMIQHMFCITRQDLPSSRAIVIHNGGTVPLLYGATIIGGGENEHLVRITRGAGGELGNFVFLRHGSSTTMIEHDCNPDQRVTQSSSYSGETTLSQERDFLFLSDRSSIWDPSGTVLENTNLIGGGCAKLQGDLFTRRTVQFKPDLVSIPPTQLDWVQADSTRVFDPRPIPGRNSYLVYNEAIAREDARYGPPATGRRRFFAIARHIGAFDGDLWLSKLSALDTYFHKLPDNVQFDGVMCGPVKDTLFLSGQSYIMTCSVTVGSSATVVLSAGARVHVMPSDNRFTENRSPFLIVQPGGILHMNGVSPAPVTFTTAMSKRFTQDVKSHGLWGGILLFGIAPVSHGIRNLDTLITPGSLGKDRAGRDVHTTYGLGALKSHNAGVIKHVRIWHAGSISGLGALTLGGIGDGTEVENVEVGLSGGVGVQVRGGAVNLRYVSSTANLGVAINFLQGYQGKSQYMFALAHGSEGVVIGNEDDGTASKPSDEGDSHVNEPPPYPYNETNSSSDDESSPYFVRTRPLVSHMSVLGVRTDQIENGPWSDPFNGVSVENFGPGADPIPLLALAEGSRVGGDIRNSLFLDLNSEFSGPSMKSLDYCGTFASNIQTPPEANVTAENYPADSLYISSTSNLVGINQLSTRTTPVLNAVVSDQSGSCPTLSFRTVDNPRDIVGCPQLRLQLINEAQADAIRRIFTQPSTFDPRLAIEDENAGGVRVDPILSEDPAVGFFRLDEEQIGAFPSTLWIQGLSFLDDYNLLNPNVNLESNLRQCQGVPTASPTHRPTFKPTPRPTTVPRPTADGETIAPTTTAESGGRGEDGNGGGEVKVVETCGVLCVIGIIAIIAAITVVLLVAYKVSRRLDLENGRGRGGSYGDGLGGDTLPLQGQQKEIMLTPRGTQRYDENGAYAFADGNEAHDNSRAAVVV